MAEVSAQEKSDPLLKYDVFSPPSFKINTENVDSIKSFHFYPTLKVLVVVPGGFSGGKMCYILKIEESGSCEIQETLENVLAVTKWNEECLIGVHARPVEESIGHVFVRNLRTLKDDSWFRCIDSIEERATVNSIHQLSCDNALAVIEDAMMSRNLILEVISVSKERSVFEFRANHEKHVIPSKSVDKSFFYIRRVSGFEIFSYYQNTEPEVDDCGYPKVTKDIIYVPTLTSYETGETIREYFVRGLQPSYLFTYLDHKNEEYLVTGGIPSVLHVFRVSSGEIFKRIKLNVQERLSLSKCHRMYARTVKNSNHLITTYDDKGRIFLYDTTKVNSWDLVCDTGYRISCLRSFVDGKDLVLMYCPCSLMSIISKEKNTHMVSRVRISGIDLRKGWEKDLMERVLYLREEKMNGSNHILRLLHEKKIHVLSILLFMKK